MTKWLQPWTGRTWCAGAFACPSALAADASIAPVGSAQA